MGTKGVVGSIIGAVISLYVLANVGPDAISSIINANTTGWGTGLSNLFTVVVPTMAVIGFVAMVIAFAYKYFN